MKNTVLLVLIIFATSSCAITNKLFHKNKSTTDSTSVVHERKDSTVTNDQFTIHKSQIDDKDETVIDWGFPNNFDTVKRGNEYLPYYGKDSAKIIYYRNSPDDYFFFNTKTGEIKSNKVPVSIRIKTSQSVFNYDSLVNHSKIELNEVSDNMGHLKKVQKETVKEVHKKKLWWWLLLLIPIYIAYRNRDKIRAFVIHLFTGL